MTIIGATALDGERFGARVPARNRLPLEFRNIPPAYTPDPNSTPTLVVSDTTLRCSSTTDRWDVFEAARSCAGISVSSVVGRTLAGYGCSPSHAGGTAPSSWVHASGAAPAAVPEFGLHAARDLAYEGLVMPRTGAGRHSGPPP